MKTLQTEIDFLEQYYDFYLKSQNDNFASFIASAQKTLVDAGQINQDSLDKFQQMYNAQQEVAKKDEQIRKLENQILILKREINELSTKFKNKEEKKSSSSQSGNNDNTDPCYRGSIGIRGGC